MNMVNIQLSEEEASLLIRSLEWSLSEIRMEIADTDSCDFRDGVKQEKRALEHAIEQMKIAMAA